MQGVENQVQYSISVSLIRNILRPLFDTFSYDTLVFPDQRQLSRDFYQIP